MSQTAIDAKLEAEFAAVAASSGCELVHVEFRQGRLQVFLDRPQGVTVDDCQSVSKQISALLDVSDFSGGSYILEVSSPGLDRQLYGPKDYERFCGHLARVTFTDGETPVRKTIVGRLEAYRPDENGGGEITLADSDKPGERHEIALANIRKARLEIEFQQ